jgi:dihydroorotate dehydrogenase electron transfer subunit
VRQALWQVTANDEIMPRTHIITLDAPELGRSSVAGQFVHIRASDSWDPLLRRPMSIFRIRPDGVSLMVRSVGRGSERIAGSQPGSWLDCLGPLGRGFSLDSRNRRLLLVGGGYGAAPLIALAEAALPRGSEVTLLVGAATAAHVFPTASVPPEVEYYCATVDGSLGHHGLVTELVPRFLDWADAVYGCGPNGMLESLARECRPRSSLLVELAMEQQMGCAMGVCLGCVTPTVRGYRRVCRDGPVFDAAELVWGSARG